MSIEEIFKSIENSPIKFKFFQSKLNYLLLILDIGTIDQFILPIFKTQCHNSIIYLNKSITPLLNNDNNNKNNNNNNNPIIPYYLINNILFWVINDKDTWLFQKFKISLVCKKFFKIVSNLLNYSATGIPFNCYYYYYGLERQGLKKYSLLEPIISNNLSIKVNHILRPDYFILSVFKSLKTLELYGIINNDIIDKRNFQQLKQQQQYGSLKNISIKTSFIDAKKCNKTINELGSDNFNLQLNLQDGFQIGHGINTDFIFSLSLELNTFFQYYTLELFSYKNLNQFSILVNKINHSLAKTFKIGILSSNDNKNKNNNNDLIIGNNIKNLEFILTYNGLIEILFGYFEGCVGLEIIKFKFHSSVDQIHQRVVDIFNFLKLKMSIFKNLKQISFSDQYGYSLDIDWLNIDTLPFNTISNFKFIDFLNKKKV
ncbi:hypothetical protein ACTFIR_008891 [Dictyostelium discoideum]